MSDPLLLALDQGTTSSRAIVFNAQGEAVSQAQHEFRQHYPRPGWVEHDAEEIWATQKTAAEEAVAAARGKGEIRAIGITNQRETVVVWDAKTGEPVGSAIVWQDRRTADLCRSLREAGHEDEVSAATGLRLDPYFSGTKLAWLLEAKPELRSRAEAGEIRAGTIDSWLIWKLTEGGVHATDASNASRTLLCRLDTGDWDDGLLETFGLPRAWLPEVVDSSGEIGEATALDGLRGVPIAGVAGDQQAALFGQACLEPGLAKNTYGTGCFLLMPVGDRPVASRHHLLSTIAWRIGGRTEYALEGSVFVAGSAIQWLRDELGVIRSAAECDELAGTVEDSHGAVLVPAFTGLGAPQWDPYARGALLGLTRGVNRAHLCRAALEAIALQTADLVDCMREDAGRPLTELRADGGASRSRLLLQIQADLLGIPVVRPVHVETTAWGAAGLAGLAVGVWKDRADFSASWQADLTVEPDPAADPAALRRAWTRAVERSRDWVQEPPRT